MNCSEILSAVFLLSTYSGRMHIEIQDCTTALRRRAWAATSRRGGQDRCGRQGGWQVGFRSGFRVGMHGSGGEGVRWCMRWERSMHWLRAWNVEVWAKVQVCLEAATRLLRCAALAFPVAGNRLLFNAPPSPPNPSCHVSRHGWPSEAYPSPRRKLCIPRRRHLPPCCLRPAHRCRLRLAQAGHQVHTAHQHPLHHRYPSD